MNDRLDLIPAALYARVSSVLAIATWDRERSEPQYREGLRCDSWEVVVPELVFEPGHDSQWRACPDYRCPGA